MTDHNSIIIAAAIARADADVAQGITDLEAAIADAPEWDHTTHLGGTRPVAIPVRSKLVGMLDHLRSAYALNHFARPCVTPMQYDESTQMCPATLETPGAPIEGRLVPR